MWRWPSLGPAQHLLPKQPEAFQGAGEVGDPLVAQLTGWEAELLVAYARRSPVDWRLLCSDVSLAPLKGRRVTGNGRTLDGIMVR